MDVSLSHRKSFYEKEGYLSEKPTQQKEGIYNFFEENKKKGTVSGKAINNYVYTHGEQIVTTSGRITGNPQGEGRSVRPVYEIQNKKGTVLAELAVNKQKKASWWAVH